MRPGINQKLHRPGNAEARQGQVSAHIGAFIRAKVAGNHRIHRRGRVFRNSAAA